MQSFLKKILIIREFLNLIMRERTQNFYHLLAQAFSSLLNHKYRSKLEILTSEILGWIKITDLGKFVAYDRRVQNLC